jgi:hypothetical protein
MENRLETITDSEILDKYKNSGGRINLYFNVCVYEQYKCVITDENRIKIENELDRLHKIASWWWTPYIIPIYSSRSICYSTSSPSEITYKINKNLLVKIIYNKYVDNTLKYIGLLFKRIGIKFYV